MLSKQASKILWWLIIIAVSMIIAWMDWQSGHELSLFVFYFIPVGLTAWQLGTLPALIVSIWCASLWFGADVLAGHKYSAQHYAVWNTLARLTAFIAIGWSISRIRKLLILEQEKARELQRTMAELRILEGFLPICSQCKKIRDQAGKWHQIESYISAHSHASFTHGLCSECAKELMAEAGMDTCEFLARLST